MEIRAQFPRASRENEILTITDVMFPDRGEESCCKARGKYKLGGQKRQLWESKVTMNLLDLFQC